MLEIFSTQSKVKTCDLCGTHSDDFDIVRTFNSSEWDPVRNYFKDNSNAPNIYRHIPLVFNYVMCNNCGLVFVSPRLKDKIVNKFYDDYLSGKFSGYVNLYDSEHRESIFQSYLSLFKGYIPISEKIQYFLDIGCASGFFLKLMNQQGFTSEGIEVSPIIGEKAKRYGNIYIGDVVDQLNRLPDNKYSVISLVDSIEHFKSPRKALQLVFYKLKQDGIVFIETPNYYAHRDEMSRHFYLFTSDTLEKLLTETGFKVLLSDLTGAKYNPTDRETNNRFLTIIAQKC